jgi:cation diffusion facilitator CzcD-associated flavoprotein CzcO
VQNTADVLIIGAGPAGLACAAVLRRAGVAATVLERSGTPAASWRARPTGLRLNTSRAFSHLPGLRFPRRAGTFPGRDDVVSYLESYAAHHRLDIRPGTDVRRIDRATGDDPAGARWALTTARAPLPARHVVVATGLLHAPFIPDWPGRDTFAGTVVPAAGYRDPAVFRGRDVVVVGAGCSGMEIAAELAGNGAATIHLSIRTPPNILLRSIAGLPGDPAAMLLLHLAPGTADAFLAPLRRLTIGDLTAYGLPVPAEGPFQRLSRTGDGPAVVDRAVLRHIRSGRIRVVPEVTALEAGGVRLADDRHVRADAVIAATGYRTALTPLIGHLDVLDDRGRPAVGEDGQAVPGLWFIGFRPQPGQLGALGAEARRIAAGITAAASPVPAGGLADPGGTASMTGMP